MPRTSKLKRLITALYCIWFFMHLAFLAYADENADSGTFWPFITKDQALASTYDIFEFFIYTGVPLVLFICYTLIFPSKTEEEQEVIHRRHSSHSFFLAFLDEKIKAEELKQQLNELTNQPTNYNYLNQLKKDRDKAGNVGVNGWLERLEIKKRYKEYENLNLKKD